MVRYVVLSALMLLPVAVFGQSAAKTAAESLSLSQAIDIALRQNRLVAVERMEVDKAADRTAALSTRRLPGVDLSLLQLQWFNPPEFRFRRGIFGVFPGLGPVPPVNTNISSSYGPSLFVLARATQPLTQLHRIGLGIKLSEFTREAAEQKLQAKRREITHQVKRSYYAILQLQSAIDTGEESLKLYRELDRVVESYVVQQVALTSDSLDVKTQLAKEEYEMLRMHNTLASAKEQLNSLLGRDLRIDFAATPVTDAALYEVELAMAQNKALAERPELKEAQLKLKQAEYDRRIKKAEGMPDISLNFTYFSAFGVSVLPQNASGVGFTMNWEPFDWGRRKYELSEKDKTIEQARAGVQEAEAQILREVGDRFRKLQEARALLRVARLGQEAAQEKLRIATNKYAQEVTLYKDVLQHQTALAQASDRYQQALLGFWTARADFEKAIGEI